MHSASPQDSIDSSEDLSRTSPEAARASERGPGRIGPNAITQLQSVLIEELGTEAAAALFAASGLAHYRDRPPTAMIDQHEVARLHHRVRKSFPEAQVRLWMREAGDRTGRYILAHRIPRLAVALLPRLPSRLSARLLMRAIGAHAWTFAGSGDFRIARRPGRGAVLIAEIRENPVVALDHSSRPICDWHAAVFRRLFRTLVSRRTTVQEVECCAAGAPCCRFEIRLNGDPDPESGRA